MLNSHALLRIHIIGGQRLVRIAPPSLSSHHKWSSNQGLPVLHLDWSALPRVSSGCGWPPSPTTPVVCSQWIGWWLSHRCSAIADFSITPLSQASWCSFNLVSSLSNVDLATAPGDMIYHIGGNVSFTLVLLSHLLVHLKFVHWESSG